MKFQSGNHLSNYLLKILKNNEITIEDSDIEKIKQLSNVFTFIENLPSNVKEHLDLSNGYQHWISLAQTNHYKKLSEISSVANKNIISFTNDHTSISFDLVFKSFELGIKYEKKYLRTKPTSDDIYYPHHFEILLGHPTLKKWNIAYFNKPIISKEDKMGCYFIYDMNGEIVYVGKSNSNLFERSCTSAQDRTKGNFSKIELYPMPTHADTNIYEMYFIAKHYPKYNSDSCYPDKPTFELPQVEPKYVIERKGTKSFDIEQINPRPMMIPVQKYWESPQSYYLVQETDNVEKFNLFFTENKQGVVNSYNFRKIVEEMQEDGYLTFVYNDKNNCFRQFT